MLAVIRRFAFTGRRLRFIEDWPQGPLRPAPPRLAGPRTASGTIAFDDALICQHGVLYAVLTRGVAWCGTAGTALTSTSRQHRGRQTARRQLQLVRGEGGGRGV